MGVVEHSADVGASGITVSTRITSQFEGHDITTYVFRGRICWIAQEVGAAVGYTEEGFRSVLQDWSPELIHGTDIEVLRGDDLREFKELLEARVKKTLAFVSQLTVLYEPGFYLICFRTHLPLGVKLRRVMADDVMPKLMRGEPVIPATAAAPELEAQVRLLALRHREALSIYAAIPGLYDPEFLRHKAEHGAALVTGEKPAIENPLLDVQGYLRSRGLDRDVLKKRSSVFGKRVKALYVAQHGKPPGVLPRDVNGGSRDVFCYTEQDRPLFDRAFEEMFAAALKNASQEASAPTDVTKQMNGASQPN